MCSVPTTVSATRSGELLDAVALRPSSARSSAGERAATASVAPHGVGHGEARVERAGGGADHLGQPRPGLDRLGDRVERLEIGHAAQPQK